MSAAGRRPEPRAPSAKPAPKPPVRSGRAQQASPCVPPGFFGAARVAPETRRLLSRCLGRDRLAIGGLPSPRARAVAALHHPPLVDLGADLAVTGEQRLGRAHLGAQRQLALGKAVGAVLLVFGRAAVGLRSARAIGALVHLAARAEIADARILRRAERTGVEAVSAADADVLGVEDDGVGRRVEGVGRAHGGARRVGAVHARHGDRPFARLAVIDGDDAPAVDAPRHLVLVLAGGDAGVALDATVGVAEKFHSCHGRSPYAALIWQSVALGSCMPVTGSYP